jgi:hypothetical protein
LSIKTTLSFYPWVCCDRGTAGIPESDLEAKGTHRELLECPAENAYDFSKYETTKKTLQTVADIPLVVLRGFWWTTTTYGQAVMDLTALVIATR